MAKTPKLAVILDTYGMPIKTSIIAKKGRKKGMPPVLTICPVCKGRTGKTRITMKDTTQITCTECASVVYLNIPKARMLIRAQTAMFDDQEFKTGYLKSMALFMPPADLDESLAASAETLEG